MKNIIKLLLFGMTLFAAFLLIALKGNEKRKHTTETLITESVKVNGTTVQEALEKAYFEGQRDALSGNVHIEEVGDHCYRWISSPWDSGKAPIYRPCPDDI